MRNLRAFILCLLPFWLSGCGLKTPVVPPSAAAPERIRDLTVRQDETGIALSWSAPERSRNGKRLPPDITYRILRAASAFDDFCPDCPRSYTEAAKTKKTAWRDPALRPGRIYSYRVVAETGPFYPCPGLPSNRALAAWDQPPPAPPPPEVIPGDHRVRVRVRTEKYGFELEKKRGSGFKVVMRRPAAGEAEFIDRETANGEAAVYRLRLLKPAGGSGLFVRGPASETVSAVPRDRTPPPPVARLTAVATGAEVSLFWPPVSAPDLAGYRIIRETGGKSAPIGRTGPEASHFVDHAPPAGPQRWRYRVDTVDRAGNRAPGPWAEFERVE